jgi:aryl-alcohol dehydrogenase-like predicted oxidoreductase
MRIARARVLRHPGITVPIIGASKMHHLDDAVAALSLKLDTEELGLLAESYRPHSVLGHS